MRKSFYSLLAMAMCLFASTSCSEEELTYEGGDKQNVTFQVEMEDTGTGSRALSDGSMVDKVYYAVYETGKDQLLTFGNEIVSGGAASVNIPLVNGLKFDIIFFAHHTETDGSAFNVPSNGDLRNIQMKSSLKANQEAYDAFFHAEKAFQTNSNTTTPVKLKRPLAQLNVATTGEDLENAANLNATVTHSKIVLKGVPTLFDARSGIASGNANVMFETEAILKQADGTNEILTVGTDQFNYLAMAYVLVNDESGLFDSEFEFYRADEDEPSAVGDMVSKRVIPNLPLQRNYRTNVTGNILTQNENFSITLDTDFNNTIHHVEASDITVEDISELNTTLAKLAKPNTKELILNVKGLSTCTDVAINIPDNATVSSITLNLLDLSASVTELKVTGENNVKPVLVSIPVATTVTTTTINVPNAHVTLKQGTHTTVYSTTDDETLEVAAGTVITNLTVKKGNVEIKKDGTIGTITAENDLDITVSVEPGGTLTNIPTSENIKVETTLEDFGNEWILTENVTLVGPITIPAESTMTIDLNGFTISQEKEQTAGYEMILNDGNLTIQDSKGGGKISYTDTGKGGEYVSNTITNRGTLTIKSGSIENNSSEAMANVGYAYAIDTSIWGEATETIVNIEGGEIKSTYSPLRVKADSQTEKVEANISGGTFYGRIDHQMSSSEAGVIGILNISGGTFNKFGIKETSLQIFGAGLETDASGIVANITGGDFEGGIVVYRGEYVPLGKNFNENFISGGTFSTDISAYVAEGYEAEENEDGTYDVVKGDYLSLGEFVNAVINANGTYDGQGALVKIVPVSGQTDNSNGCKVPDRLQKYGNPDVYYAQYQRFSELTDVSISNVNFEFVPAAVTVTDVWNTAGATTTAKNINGELQFMNSGAVTLENCTFNMVSVSPIKASELTVEGCTFNNLLAYAIKDINASVVSINGNTFSNCDGGFWFNAAPFNLKATGNTFSEVGRRGAIQFSASGDYANTTMLISGNKVEGNGAFLWQLNGTVTAEQIESILDKKNNTYETAFVANSIDPRPVAQIGSTKYKTLQAAIENVQANETIQLLKDVTFETGANETTNGISYTRGASFTLDLNNKTITSNLGNNALRFKIGDGNEVANAEVTIEIKNGKIISGSNNWCAISAATADGVNNKLVMNLNNLEIENSKAGDYAIKSWAGAVVNATNVKVISSYGGSFYAVGGEMVLDNCTAIQTGLHTAPYQSMAVAVSTSGKTTVKSGNYTTVPAAASDANNQGTSHGSWCAGVMNSGGILIIEGGTFANGNYGDDTSATAARGLLLADTGANIQIEGGNFEALKSIIDIQNNLGEADKNPSVTLSGGTFSADPVNDNGHINVAEGYEAKGNENGTWTVSKQ